MNSERFNDTPAELTPDQKFYIATGKTPEQEARDSGRMLGKLLLCTSVIVAVITIWSILF